MQNFLLIIHLLVVIFLVALVLIQQTASGGLGFGGNNDFMSVRGTKNALTRLTAILAVIFFINSLLLTVVANLNNPANQILHNLPKSEPEKPITLGSQTITVGGDQDKAKSKGTVSAAGNAQPMTLTIPDEMLHKNKK